MNPTADILRRHWPVESEKTLNLYLGTGRCGGCFDAYGLQHQDDLSPVTKRVSRTWLAHAEVWHRGRHGLDTQVPLARLRWSELPGEPTHYRQHLELAAGRLTTEFVGQNFRYTLTTFTNPAAARRDLLFFHLRWEGARRPDLVFVPVPVYPSEYSGDLIVQCTPSLNGRRATLDLRRGSSQGVALALATGDLRVAIHGNGAVFHLDASAGAGIFVVALGPAARREELHAELDHAAGETWEMLRAEAEEAWRARWGQTVFNIACPDQNALAWRSAYHLLCSYAPDVRCPAPP
ncbi:MAG: hypothetical protein WCS42_15600, partial [Verrucomicrobiota bacterium]